MLPVNHLPTLRVSQIALLIAWSVLVVGCGPKHPPLATLPPTIVMVAKPEVRTVTNYQIFTARTQAVESVDIKARVSGYLMEILFKDGDLVEKGEVLFKIDDRPYKAALDEAKANLQYAKAALVEAEANYQIGVNVRKANPAAISEQELNQRLGSRDEAAASVLQAEASIESAQLNFDWCTVEAPISGRANRHFVDVGNLVSQDVTTLTNIVSIKPIWAYFDVDQNTALDVEKLVAEGKIKGARETMVPADLSLSNDTTFPIAGAIDFVSNQLDPNTGSLRVRAAFPNEDGFIGAGLFGRVRVPIGVPHEALLVADQAIGTNQGQKYVLVINDQDVVEYRAVEVQQLHDGLREVLRYRTVHEPNGDGPDTSKEVEVLSPTDRIIVQGLQRVRPGARVETQLVDMETMLVEKPTGIAAEAQKSAAESKSEPKPAETATPE